MMNLEQYFKPEDRTDVGQFLDEMSPGEVSISGDIFDPRVSRSKPGTEIDFDIEICNFSTQPRTKSWALSPLFHLSLDGKKLFWQVGFHEPLGILWILHGMTISVPQLKNRQILENSSGRSLEQQGLVEARGRYRKQFFKGYKTLEEVSPYVGAMNAHDYKPGTIKSWPVAIQPKIDGIRVLSSETEEGVCLLSRTGRPYLYRDHIRAGISKLLSAMTPGTVLDGEVYSNQMPFNELSGIMRTQKFDHKKNHLLVYYVFDVVDLTAPFEVRYSKLRAAFRETSPSSLVLVETLQAENDGQIGYCLDKFLSEGYEGCMIRRIASSTQDSKERELSLYRPTRCNNLLKVKKFDDQEVTIIGVGQGSGSEEGLAIFQVREDSGIVFEVRPSGTFEQRKTWFKNSSAIIGKHYTVKFFGRSEYGVPRFPTGVAFRDYE